MPHRTPTEEFERPSGSTAPDDQTVILPGQRAEPLRTAPSSSGQHCASCGAVLAPDQRYCVECGQRRGPTRTPYGEAAGQQQASAPTPPSKRGPRFSPNAALIAGIGTLMLAMATGVLIGRTSAPSSKNAPIQYVGAPTTGVPSTSTGATSTESASEGSSSAKSGGSGGKSGSGKSTPSSAAKLLGGKAPSKPVVKIGSAGKGPGYQKGKFTGKFFGGGESKKEEEEELGEEGGEESSGSGTGKK